MARLYQKTQLKVAIIDHVGIEAGMNYYDDSLTLGLVNNNAEGIILSNYISENSSVIYKKVFKVYRGKNIFVKLFNYLWGSGRSAFLGRKMDVDLVVMHLFSANLITFLIAFFPKLFGLKIALIAHDVSSFVGSDSNFIQNRIYNKIADYIIVHNQFSYDTLIANIKIENKKKIKVIKHGGYQDHISNKITRKQAREKLGLKINGKYLLFFGQIKKVKGLDILLNAFAKLPDDFRLIIAGKVWKDNFNYYHDIIERNDLNKRITQFIRFIEDEERELFFYAADAIVLPYRVIFQSGVLLMAMSYGIPVIASDLPSNVEIINSGYNGVLFKSKDPEDLALKIQDFFLDKKMREDIRNNSIKTIKEDFNWLEIADKYIKLIK